MSRVGFDVFRLEELPPAWEMRSLADLASHVFGGGTPSTRNPDLWGGDIPWTTSAVLEEKCIYLTNHQRRITKKGLQESAAQIVPTGSVLIGTRVGVGKTAVTTFDIAISQDLTALVPAPDVCPEYIALVLKSPPVVAWFAENKRGTTIKGVTRADVVRLMVPNPPLPEQRAIAAVLRTVQRTKEVCEKMIAATRALKQSLLHHLFTYGPVPFDQADRVVLKETKVGMVPEHWRTAELGDNTRHCAFGPRFSGDLYDPVGNVATLRTTDIADDGRINYLTMPRARIDGAKFASHFLENGDFLVTRSGTCGIASVFDGFSIPVLAGAFLIRFVLNDEVFPYFLRDYFNSLLGRRRIEKIASGAVQKNISGTSLKAFLIPLPKIAEQCEIASHLSAVDAKLAAEEKRRTALDNLFQSLLHNLMTGRVRVNHLFDELVGADPRVGLVGGAHGGAPLPGGTMPGRTDRMRDGGVRGGAPQRRGNRGTGTR